MKHNILVLGSNGFIGQNFILHVKNHSTYSIPYQNIREYTPQQIFNFVIKNDITIVLNALNPGNSLLKELTEFDKKFDCLFIHICSAAVYGNFSHSEIINESSTKIPINNYGDIKLLDYHYVLNFSNLFSRVFILRPSSLIGPKMNRLQLFGRIYHEHINLGRKQIMLDEVNSFRDFLFIDDFINIINDLIIKSKENFLELNIGTGKNLSTEALISTLLRHKEIIRNKENYISNESTPTHSNWQLNKLKSTIGYLPSFNLQSLPFKFWS